jgi:hypothetical protein
MYLALYPLMALFLSGPAFWDGLVPVSPGIGLMFAEDPRGQAAPQLPGKT